jgi:hypothetical protein
MRVITGSMAGYGVPAEQGDAEGDDPQGPCRAADEAGQIPHREAGYGGGEDVALVEQVQPAGDQSGPTDPGREYPAAHDHHRDGDRPAEDEQLPEVLAEQSTAELVLRRPRRAHGGLRGGVTGDVGFGQRRDDEDPAQEPDQRQQDRGGSDEGRGAPRSVLLFTGRYPGSLYSFIIGMDGGRWTFARERPPAAAIEGMVGCGQQVLSGRTTSRPTVRNKILRLTDALTSAWA